MLPWVNSRRRHPLALPAFILCSAFFLPVNTLATPWPGETWNASVDLTFLNPAGWASNLSGAYWNAATRRLWVCLNGPAKFWSLQENGGGGFQIEREYDGTGDLEGITQIDSAQDLVFVIDEQARILRAYRISDGVQFQTWSLADIPNWGNSGPEGIAAVPNAWLARNGFVDGNGNPYPQSIHGAGGFGALLFVAVQTNGWIYAFDLKNDGTLTFVGRYLTSRMESCELSFDASTGRLYILHNIDGNWLEVTDLTSVVSGSDRKLGAIAEFQAPSGSNVEGFALTPAVSLTGTAGDSWCFFTDDSNAAGALRWFRQFPSTLTKQAGNNQTAHVGQAVAIPPEVLARDAFGNPMPDLNIAFSVLSGGGLVTGGEAVAGQDGTATPDAWVLGPDPGANTLSASATGLSGSPQIFAATATAPPLPLPNHCSTMGLVGIWIAVGFRAILKHHTHQAPKRTTHCAWCTCKISPPVNGRRITG
jgi:hypothetical protein